MLLVLEDLHWIDPVSFDLLELAARAIEKLPVLILLTYRPPDADPSRHTLTRLEALDHFTQLRLTELNVAETEQAIRAKLAQLFPERGGVVPPLLITRITSRAQGNPFYVEELLNYLHDRGIDPRDATALSSLDLPTSLYSLILSRIDQLADSQQLSLKVASIIGRIFRFADLHNYYPSLGTAEQLKADLQELARLDLTPLETPEPELTYLFKHIVTHEVATRVSPMPHVRTCTENMRVTSKTATPNASNSSHRNWLTILNKRKIKTRRASIYSRPGSRLPRVTLMTRRLPISIERWT